MELTNDMLSIPDWLRHQQRDRYFPIEGNGVVGMIGWVQRPAALHNTERAGKGLWDNREKRIIQQPRPIERLKRLTGVIRNEREKIATLERVVGEIERVHGIDRHDLED